jgi:uncharacterized repeat protein (TIGR02543 family)
MNTKNKIFIILFLVFSVANFSFGASSQQAVFVPNSSLAPSQFYPGQIKISGNDQLNNSPLQDQILNFTLNVQSQPPQNLTLNLSTDKTQYQVGESAQYTISGSALPQNPSNGQTITAIIYAVTYPPGRGGCANGCNVTFTYLNGSWSAYSNPFISSDGGDWTVHVTYNNTQSNDVSYTVMTLNLSTDKIQYQVGESAKYTIWGSVLPQNPSNGQTITATIYAVTFPTGRGGCANGCGVTFTYSNNSWSAFSNPFTSSDFGNWTVYVTYNNTQSNNVSYTVGTGFPPSSQPAFWIFPASSTLSVGGSVQLQAYYDPDGPGPQTETIVTDNSNWSSSNPSVATVGDTNSLFTRKGLVTGISQGQATITATYNNLSANATVNVTGGVNPTPKYICSNGQCVRDDTNGTFSDNTCNNQCLSQAIFDVSPPTILLPVGSTTQIYAFYYEPPRFPFTTDVSLFAAWSSSDDNIATVYTTSTNTSKGPISIKEVKGVSPGTAIITASYYSYSNLTLTAYATVIVYQGYSCVNNTCNPDSNGQFTSLSACQSQCGQPPPQRYSCVNNTCNPDSNGQFTSLSACQSQCGQPPPPLFCLLINITPTGAGIVNVNPPNKNCPPDCTICFSTSSSITLNATSSRGYVFKGWQGACSGTNPTCQTTISGNTTVDAIFNPYIRIREIIPFNPPSLNQFLKQTASIIFGLR